MNDKATRLKALCDRAVKKYTPDGDVTYCNSAVNFICVELGYKGFRGLVANEMVDVMRKSPDFALVTPDDAQKLANDGRLVIAGIKEDEHGHVAVCYPGGEVTRSGKWRENAPLIANVGKTNGVFNANWGFGLEAPKYYAWIEPV